ncbi:hypothetical protein CSPX01_10504, partial [Colletotrichum filicis]
GPIRIDASSYQHGNPTVPHRLRPTLINDRPGSEMVFSGGSAPPSTATRTQNNMHLGIDYSTSSDGSHRSMVVNALQVRQA